MKMKKIFWSFGIATFVLLTIVRADIISVNYGGTEDILVSDGTYFTIKEIVATIEQQYEIQQGGTKKQAIEYETSPYLFFGFLICLVVIAAFLYFNNSKKKRTKEMETIINLIGEENERKNKR